MATASELIKARRKAQQENSHVIEQTAEEKIAAIDSLFSSLPSAPPASAKQSIAVSPKFVPQKETNQPVAKAGGVEIFSTFGGGSILIEDKSVTLPTVVTDPILLMKLKTHYGIDAPNSILKSRRL